MSRRFQAAMYVTVDGTLIAARDTDQAGKRGVGTEGRTQLGYPVEYAGTSYQVERQYHKPVIARARSNAARRLLLLGGFKAERYLRETIEALALAAELDAATPAGIVADWYEEKGEPELAATIRSAAFAQSEDQLPGECWQCRCRRLGRQHTNGPCKCTRE